MIYKLHLPIKISFILDIDELQIHDIDELIYLQDKHDVDIQNIIDEYEYKLEAEESYLNEYEDSFGVNNIEILQTVINDNLSEIIEKFNKEYKLSSLTNTNVNKLFTVTRDNFNNNLLLKENKEYKINSVHIKSYDITESSFIIDVDVDRELIKSELIGLKSDIDDKYVDGWGSQFENTDLSDIIKEESMYVYLKCWDEEKSIDFIKQIS